MRSPSFPFSQRRCLPFYCWVGRAAWRRVLIWDQGWASDSQETRQRKTLFRVYMHSRQLWSPERVVAWVQVMTLIRLAGRVERGDGRCGHTLAWLPSCPLWNLKQVNKPLSACFLICNLGLITVYSEDLCEATVCYGSSVCVGQSNCWIFLKAST